VDGERGSITEVQKVPTECYGCSGVRITVSVSNMLEGFRKGRTVRIFGPGWKVQDEFYGESLMGYGFGRMLNSELVENVAKEYPEQFPFRTDSSNATLPWYQLQPGVIPPPFSEHVVFGELINIDAATRSGRFLADRTGEAVDFTLTPEADAKFFNTKAKLDDLALSQRYRFHLYQDDKGRFTRCSFLSDDYTHQAQNALTLRIDSLDLNEGVIRFAHQLPKVKNYNGDMQSVPDIARSELHITKDTRAWNDKQPVKLTDLKPGDNFRFNCTSDQPGHPSRCTDLWLITESPSGKRVDGL
jgi:hypothetical protein